MMTDSEINMLLSGIEANEYTEKEIYDDGKEDEVVKEETVKEETVAERSTEIKYEETEKSEFTNSNGEITRFSKKGKGRFDLMPSESVIEIMKEMSIIDSVNNLMNYGNSLNIISKAYKREFIEAIVSIIIYEKKLSSDDKYPIVIDEQSQAVFNPLKIAALSIKDEIFFKTIHDVAKYYESGAEHYAPNNWKSLPLRSFIDSGLRHLNQYLSKNEDENHFLAFIWNFMNAYYISSKCKYYDGECDGYCDNCKRRK